MHLEPLSPEDIEHVEIPSATPLVYRINADLIQHEHQHEHQHQHEHEHE